jgi:dipeptidyl aminopeptidase/acylaminoacyl peptidase
MAKFFLSVYRTLFIASLLVACSISNSGTPIPETATAKAGATQLAETLVAASPVPAYEGNGPWPVALTTHDGLTIQGILYGQGVVGIVLIPTYPGGQPGWRPFAVQSAAAGYRTLSIDLRGNGSSSGETALSQSSLDVLAGVAFLRSLGVQDIVIMGAGGGGMAAIDAATSDPSLKGMAIISSPRALDGFEITESDLAALTIPSLWIGTRNDMLQDIESMQQTAGGSSKDLWIYEGSSLHGTYIFEGADSQDAIRRLLDFVAQVTG